MKVSVTAYPYAVQFGEIDIPEGISTDEIYDYLTEHWDEIEFGEADLDYAGTDFEWEAE